ncbi:hypothetical protein NDN08_006910 [Rhodosorus marinus]|uniref:FAD/NAD(P)-binding domain-containing protein n=1 Tax=Rhodosorus marinus TaxID=101924 RepID=A0AAV8UMJ8_9RHOD|nr:hypothetical protein NDN08_006910 [Rhodosorus marinus]
MMYQSVRWTGIRGLLFGFSVALNSSGWNQATLCEEHHYQREQAGPGSIPARQLYRYVICGGGTAAQAALRELLRGDPSASILVVAEEVRPPYNNSVLWRWYRGKAAIGEDGDDVLEQLEIDLNKNRGQEWVQDRLDSIDCAENRMILRSGATVQYENCLLAFGGCSATPPWGQNSRVIDGRTDSGQKKLLKILERSSGEVTHVTIVGGGIAACYMASIISASEMAHVTMVFPDTQPLARLLPKYITGYVTKHLKAHGIEILPYRLLHWVQDRGEEAEIYCSKVYDSSDVTGILTDAIVLAPTRVPACSDSGLDLHLDERLESNDRTGGIDTNRELLAASNVYVAGDLVSSAGNRIQSHTNAMASGKVAAMNMLGGRHVLNEPLMYTADIPVVNARVTFLGEVSAEQDTYAYFSSDKKKNNEFDCPGVIFYIPKRSAHICGVALWNCDEEAGNKLLEVVGHDFKDRMTLDQKLYSLTQSLLKNGEESMSLVRYIRPGRTYNKGAHPEDDETLWQAKPRPQGGSAKQMNVQNFRNAMEGIHVRGRQQN